jgi:DNA-binding MarR family transcriptional regulator
MTDATLDPIVQLSWRIHDVLDDVARAHGVSTSVLRLLAILRSREPEMLELARHLDIDKSSLSGLVARAESRGLVERTPSAADRRRVTVRLTASGRREAARGESEVYRRLGEAFAALPPRDLERLSSLARTVLDG